LITLTREPEKPLKRASMIDLGEGYRSRTDRFYVEIEKVAGEIEKGSKGGLRTRKGIQDAVDAIHEGKSVDKALEHAKLMESIEIALTREPLLEPYKRAYKGGFAVGEHYKERTDCIYH